MSEAESNMFVTGVVSGILLAPAFGSPAKCTKHISDCLVGKSNFQLGAIVRKYIQDNPEQWDWGCNFLAMSAIQSMCFKLGFEVEN